MERGEALDWDDASISRVDRVESGPPDQSKHTWRFKSVIMADQGETSKAFYNDDPRGESGASIQDRKTSD